MNKKSSKSNPGKKAVSMTKPKTSTAGKKSGGSELQKNVK